MPISRYEIRNEYSLADPELYRAADKDDPEAFLEGVAMAGLVGVLRQLGDLAEFAAEVFHNLHEDVMATAARGHALSVRVQQLETEIPSIERAFLSQIDHSSFFYHPGIDWHPNLRPEKNLVTQGDLPRFIMDSYEECRAPPRLFLLDKFDVAGAGACLKRYTDPSFFKVETTEVTNADIQREKKTRKTKKKEPRWRNRETPEVIPTSHTKLHQLFLEERVENGVNTPRPAKLKRRLTGFPFNSKTGRSYMENILKSPSPDHKMLHDMTVESPQLKLATNYHEYGSEIYEVRSVSPDRESEGRKRSTPSPDREGVALNLPMYDPDESPEDDKVFEVPSSYPRIATDGILSTIDKVTDESNREGTLTRYESEDIASEIDNYVDAPSTMESEMDKDPDLRMMSDNTSYTEMESLTKDEKPILPRSSGSQSTVDSRMFDVGYNSSMKELFSFSSDSPSISTEKTKSESFSRKGFPCTDIPMNEIVDASSHQRNDDENFLVDHHSSPVVSDDTCSETDAITNRRSESEQVLSSLCSNGSMPPPMLSDTDEVERKCMLKSPESDEEVFALDNEEDKTYPVICQPAVVSGGTCTETSAITNQRSEFEHVSSTLCINGSMPTLELSDTENAAEYCKLEAHGSDEMVSTLDDRENKIKLVMDPQPQCSPRASIFASQSVDDLSRISCGEQLVDESNGECETCLSAVHDVYPHATNNSARTSSNLLDEDESDGQDPELADDAASTSNTPNALSTNGTMDTMSHVNLIPGKFEDEFPEVTENSLSDYSDGAHNVNNFEPKGDHLMDKLDDEDSDVSTDSWRHLPEGLEGTSLASALTLNVEDNYSNSSTDNQIVLENLKSSYPANSSDDGDVIPEEDTTVNETLPLGIPEPLEVLGFLETEVSCDVSPNDSEALERLCCASKDLEEPTGTTDVVGMDGASLCSVSNAQEVAEVTSFAHAKPDHEIHVFLNKSGSEVDRSKCTDIDSPVSPVSDEGSLSMFVEEHIDCFEDSGKVGLENGKLDLVEKVGPTEASASGLGTIGCNPVDNDHPKSELSGLVPNSHLDLKCDHRREFVHASKIQSPIEKRGIDREELFEESCGEDHVHDAPSLPVDNDTEESVQDKVGLPPSHLNPFLLHPVEESLELSPLSPINYLQILDNDDGKEESNSVSVFSPAVGPSPPSISELSRLSNKEIYALGYPEDPLGSSAPNNPFLEANQINLADLPPLPPLPPVQWRMGKLQHALPSTEEETITNGEPLPQMISPTTPIVDIGLAISTEPTSAGSSPPCTATSDIISLNEEKKGSQTERATETTSEEQNLDNSCSHLESKTLHESIDHPPKIVNKPQLLARPNSESVSTSLSAEDGAENGSQRVKLLRSCNPLVDDISFLDKSKLRKVTERVMPEVHKVDERDSLLAQIRTKSFNLKPAMASRPSIRTRVPDTNLKVVAILEKANAIRQAFAGSDEDDDDSWSE